MGDSWGNMMGEADMGTTNREAVNPRSWLPGAEVPVLEGEAQFGAGVQVELDQDIA